MRRAIVQILMLILAFTGSIYLIILLTPQPEPVIYEPLPPLPACENCLSGSHNAIGTPFSITVKLFRNQADVQEQYQNLRFSEIQSRGFAEWTITNNDVECVIYGVHPRDMGDSDVLLLGQNLLHCVLGHYP